jgi:glycosyltransferase involved in cell wall biosynthesis
MKIEHKILCLIAHPIQYYTPIFSYISNLFDLTVIYGKNVTGKDHALSGFGADFTWDIDLLESHRSFFFDNRNLLEHQSNLDFSKQGKFSNFIRRERFDVVLVIGWYERFLVHGALLARALGVPLIVRGDSHMGTPRGRLKSAVMHLTYPALLRVFDVALYVGQRNFDYYRHFGYPAARLFHSPHCVDTERFAGSATPQARAVLRSRLGIRNDEKVVLFAGKLVPFKRPVDAVEAVAQLMRRSVSARLMVAGSGPMEADVRARAQALGVTVDFLGFQNQTEMPSAYAAADLMVLPSTGRETWGLVCNEALACGTPIVVSDQVGCAPDLAKDGLVGRTFSMGNITELADACAATFANPPSSAAIRAVSDQFSIQRAVGGIAEAVEIVVSDRRRRGGRVVR